MAATRGRGEHVEVIHGKYQDRRSQRVAPPIVMLAASWRSDFSDHLEKKLAGRLSAEYTLATVI